MWHFPGEEISPQRRMESRQVSKRQCNALGSVLLGNVGPAIHVAFTLAYATCLNIVADQVCHLMEVVFLDGGCGLFQQDNVKIIALRKKQ